MELIVGSQIRILNGSLKIRRYLKNELTLSNPEYFKKVRYGLWVGNTPKTFYLFSVDGDDAIVPYGCLRDIMALEPDAQVLSQFIQQPAVDYKCKIPLYDYQEKAVDAMEKAYYGILQAPAGSGKTQMAVALAARIARRCLWVTHTKDLLRQSYNRAARYMPEELLGTITDGKVHIGKAMTFATVQTLAKIDLTQYADTWDTIICDECHRMGMNANRCTMFAKVYNTLRARHKYGVSATVHRSDGLIKTTFALCGNVVYTVSEAEVKDKIMTADVIPVPTNIDLDESCYGTDGVLVFAKALEFLTTNEERNQHIVDCIVREKGHSCLILTDRVRHMKRLIEMLPPGMQREAVVMTGQTKMADREQIMEDMRSGKKKYLFASFALAKEGLDIPRLDRLYITTPHQDYAVVTQAVGRIARKCEGKTDAVVYDFVDNGKFFFRCYSRRCSWYRKLKSRFIEAVI